MMIAERILKIRRGLVDIDVPIRIFAPERDEAAWACRYEIGWPGTPKTQSIFGVDSVQALFLALQAIGAELYRSNEHTDGRFFLGQRGRWVWLPCAPEHPRHAGRR